MIVSSSQIICLFENYYCNIGVQSYIEPNPEFDTIFCCPHKDSDVHQLWASMSFHDVLINVAVALKHTRKYKVRRNRQGGAQNNAGLVGG